MTLQEKINAYAKYLQMLFSQGRYSARITELYEEGLEKLYQKDLDFLNEENASLN